MCANSNIRGICIKEIWYRTIATYQTLNREQRLLKFDPSAMKAVIVDEAHHAAAKS